jgi:menaquinone-dependent protoporphyrinogen oxidase
MLAGKIPDRTLISLDDDHAPDIACFGRVILGTPIYVGRPRARMARFCKQNRDVLALKSVGLFICCMWPEEDRRAEQLKGAFPEWLHEAAKAEAVLGGAFDFGRLNPLERMVIKKVANVTASVEAIDTEAIDRFAGALAD